MSLGQWPREDRYKYYFNKPLIFATDTSLYTGTTIPENFVGLGYNSSSSALTLTNMSGETSNIITVPSTGSTTFDLQGVTDNGNTTSNNMIVGSYSGNYLDLNSSYIDLYTESGPSYSNMYSDINRFRFEIQNILNFSKLEVTPGFIDLQVQNTGGTLSNSITIINNEILLQTSKLGIYGDTNKNAILTTTGYTASGEYNFQFSEASGVLPVINVSAPASSADTGVVGEIRVPNDGFLYVCVSANTWNRVAIAAW